MIGNTVKFKDYCDETYTGKVVDMFSDKFDDVKWLVMGDGELSMPHYWSNTCLLYTSPSPRDRQKSRMPSSA